MKFKPPEVSQQARGLVTHLDQMPANSPLRELRECSCSAMAVLALLAGCALERPPGVVRVTYDCDQGHGFVARYDDGTYELRLNGRNATLHGTSATYSNCIARHWQESEPR